MVFLHWRAGAPIGQILDVLSIADRFLTLHTQAEPPAPPLQISQVRVGQAVSPAGRLGIYNSNFPFTIMSFTRNSTVRNGGVTPGRYSSNTIDLSLSATCRGNAILK